MEAARKLRLHRKSQTFVPTILSLSSQVAHGHVGHSAGVFAWQRLGLDVIALPTILLSSRPDYPRFAGFRVDAAQLDGMLASLEAIGALEQLDAVFTGYLPSAGHAELAASWIGRLKAKRPGLVVMCDPILGDEPGGLYIEEAAAEALKTGLVPLADILTPNAFELGWMTGNATGAVAAAAAAAMRAAPLTLVTSCPEPAGHLSNLLVSREGGWTTQVARRNHVPHGTGDLMAALFLGHLLRSRPPAEALALATAGVEEVVEVSEGAEELRLIESQDRWVAPSPWTLGRLELPL